VFWHWNQHSRLIYCWVWSALCWCLLFSEMYIISCSTNTALLHILVEGGCGLQFSRRLVVASQRINMARLVSLNVIVVIMAGRPFTSIERMSKYFLYKRKEQGYAAIFAPIKRYVSTLSYFYKCNFMQQSVL